MNQSRAANELADLLRIAMKTMLSLVDKRLEIVSRLEIAEEAEYLRLRREEEQIKRDYEAARAEYDRIKTELLELERE